MDHLSESLFSALLRANLWGFSAASADYKREIPQEKRDSMGVLDDARVAMRALGLAASFGHGPDAYLEVFADDNLDYIDMLASAVVVGVSDLLRWQGHRRENQVGMYPDSQFRVSSGAPSAVAVISRDCLRELQRAAVVAMTRIAAIVSIERPGWSPSWCLCCAFTREQVHALDSLVSTVALAVGAAARVRREFLVENENDSTRDTEDEDLSENDEDDEDDEDDENDEDDAADAEAE